MPSIFDDNAKLPIKCPKCGREIKQTVGRLKRGNKFACPKCRTGFDPKELARGLAEAEKAIRKAFR